jgi:bifunctional non-homologous end joining protein LigD
MILDRYKKKRDFLKTPEPKKNKKAKSEKLIFVVQKHRAKRLHYDFRLEMGGVLKSWAVPKGPSKSPSDKRLAILTEDHPLSYADFEGTIPQGQYGAGSVEIWDSGEYENIKVDESGKLIPLLKCFKSGQIEINLKGKKLNGNYALVNFKDKNWLLIKMKKK